MSFSSNTYFNTLKRVSPIAAANLPSGYFGSYSQSISANAGTGAFSMDSNTGPTVLAGQSSFTNVFSNVTTGTNVDLGLAQFISSPLTAQTVATAGTTTWTVRAAMKMSNAAANFTYTFRAALYLVNGSGGSVGTIKSTLFSLTNIGASKSATGELTAQQASIATAGAGGTVYSSADKDYLVLEWGVNVNNTSGGSLAPNITFYADGVNTIASDNVTATDAASQLVCSSTITTYPIVARGNIAVPQLLQPRGPGEARAKIALPPAAQSRGPGEVRASFSAATKAQPRAGDTDLVLMRGFDSSLNAIVYWVAGSIDSIGAMYSGDQTKLSDIVAVTLNSGTAS